MSEGSSQTQGKKWLPSIHQMTPPFLSLVPPPFLSRRLSSLKLSPFFPLFDHDRESPGRCDRAVWPMFTSSSSTALAAPSLPPLPSRPYPVDSLAAYISDFILPDGVDLSSGPAVRPEKVRAWWYRSIRFSRQDRMLDEMEERLSRGHVFKPPVTSFA